MMTLDVNLGAGIKSCCERRKSAEPMVRDYMRF